MINDRSEHEVESSSIVQNGVPSMPNCLALPRSLAGYQWPKGLDEGTRKPFHGPVSEPRLVERRPRNRRVPAEVGSDSI